MLAQEHLGRGGGGPPAQARDGFRAAIGQADKDWRHAADVHQVGHQHAQRHAGGDARVDRVAAAGQHREAGGGGERVARGDGVAGAGGGKAHGGRLPHRGRLREAAPMETPVLLAVDHRGIATATLNRPALGNAYNGEMLEGLITGMERLAADPAVRALVIRGAGKNFQAGADIHWLSAAAGAPPGEAFAASLLTTRAMQRLNEFPKPTFALIHGACFGGGTGIACCVDVALATTGASFGITEVRVGVAPTPISTHMVHAMGLRHARRYAITGERFGPQEAMRIGLVHEVLEPDAIEARLEHILRETLRSAPTGIAATKRSLLESNGLVLDERAVTHLANESWMQRASAEGREGLAAFREKRRPGWDQS